MSEYSEIIVVMKVEDYDEKIISILPRILAEYQAERVEYPDTFCPFGYQGDYTASKVRYLLGRQINKIGGQIQSIDVVFSPTEKALKSWKHACKKNTFPAKFDLGPKKKSWRYMDVPVDGQFLIPERYAVWGVEPTPYYALLIKDLEIFNDPMDERWIDLRSYRMMREESEEGWELRGRWRQKSAIPCFQSSKLSEFPRNPEPVIAKAKLVYPYAVQLSRKPFESS
ncbi:MAG: hypothetical protein P1Q69_21105 [Candidatus Thorarchaeota archaeon]|nr:hypothetical protein [Candidatus Thorarchaeota archaeon]